MSNPLTEGRHLFLAELKKRVSESREALMSLKEQGFDDGAYATLYRFAHTLKGSGAMLGLSAIADLAVEIHAVLLLIKDYAVNLEPGIEQFLNDRLQQIEVEADKFRGEEASASQDNSVTTFSVLGKKILLVDDDPDY